jgi:hypothetical protein
LNKTPEEDTIYPLNKYMYLLQHMLAEGVIKVEKAEESFFKGKVRRKESSP